MKFWIFLCFLVLNLMTFGQLNIESPFDKVQFNRDSIETHKIRSVLVFAEMGMNGDFQNGIISGKAREFEFDSLGNVIYKISSYDDGYYPFAEFGRGSEIEYSSYNDQNLRTFFCQENFKRVSEYYSEFDTDGNLVLTENIIEGKNVSGHDKRSFEWKKGRMVKSVLIVPIDADQTYKATYDDKGRCLEVNYDNSKTINVYSEIGDTLIEGQVYSRADTCQLSYTSERLKQFPEQYVYFAQRDCNGEIISEVSVELDDQGNVSEYNSLKYEDVQNEFEFSRMLTRRIIEITNTYDERGLLIKQSFYRIHELTSEKLLIKVYRYVYEKTPLRVKFEKGELRAKEIETHENYGRDY